MTCVNSPKLALLVVACSSALLPLLLDESRNRATGGSIGVVHLVESEAVGLPAANEGN